MTKRQREAQERLLLKHMLDTNPKLKEFIDNLVESPSVGEMDIVKPIIENELKQARMIGTSIGWQAAFLRCEEAVMSMESVEEIKVYVSGEAKKVRKELNMKEKEGENERENSKT